MPEIGTAERPRPFIPLSARGAEIVICLVCGQSSLVAAWGRVGCPSCGGHWNYVMSEGPAPIPESARNLSTPWSRYRQKHFPARSSHA